MIQRVRCVLLWKDQVLLANHRYVPRSFRHCWSLPGGHIELSDSSPEAALRRELLEELEISLPEVLHYVGAWPWRGNLHQIYVAHLNLDSYGIAFEENEIRRVEWFSLSEIKFLESRRGLHTGFEYLAVKTAISKLETQEGLR